MSEKWSTVELNRAFDEWWDKQPHGGTFVGVFSAGGEWALSRQSKPTREAELVETIEYALKCSKQGGEGIFIAEEALAKVLMDTATPTPPSKEAEKGCDNCDGKGKIWIESKHCENGCEACCPGVFKILNKKWWPCPDCKALSGKQEGN